MSEGKCIHSYIGRRGIRITIMMTTPFNVIVVLLLLFWKVDWTDAANDDSDEDAKDETFDTDIPSCSGHSENDPMYPSNGPSESDPMYPSNGPSESDPMCPPNGPSESDLIYPSNVTSENDPMYPSNGTSENDPMYPSKGTGDQEPPNPSNFLFFGLNVTCHLDQLCSMGRRDNITCYCDNECVVIGDCCADWYSRNVSKSNAVILTAMANPYEWYRANVDEPQNAAIMTALMRNSKCIQTQNGTNKIAFRIIAACPTTYADEDTRRGCEYGTLHPVENIPVSLRIHASVQIVFKNRMCALCYGYKESEILSWTVSALCPKTLLSQNSEDFKKALKGECSFYMIPPSNVGELRLCQLQDRVSPPECGGNEQVVDFTLATVCKSYVAPVFDLSFYKNPHCALCFNGNYSGLTCDKPVKPNTGLLLPSFEETKQIGLNVLFNFNPDTGSWYSLEQRNCPEIQVWYPDKWGCHPLLCPKNYIPSYGRCIENEFAFYNDTNNVPLDQNGMREYNISIDISSRGENYSTPSFQSVLQLLRQNVVGSGVRIISDFQLTHISHDKGHNDERQMMRMVVNSGTAEALAAVVAETLAIVQQFEYLDMSAEVTNVEEKKSLRCISTHITHYNVLELAFIENSKHMYIKPRSSNITISLYSTRFKLVMGKTTTHPLITFLGLCNEGILLDCTLLSYTANEYVINDSIASINNVKEKVSNFDLRNDILYVCDNLTSFDFPGEGDSVMQILTVVMIAVSVISLCALLVTHCAFSSLRTVHGKNLMAFSTSLLTAQSLFLIGSYVSRTLCVIIAISQHYFWLCSFAWSSAMAFDLASKFSAKTMMTYKASTTQFKQYFALAHGLPMLLVIGCVVVDTVSSTNISVEYGSGSDAYCWIGNPMASLFVFGLPVALCLLFNMICFGISLHGIHGTKQCAKTIRNKKQERNYCIIYTKISLLLGGTWILGFLSAVINIKPLLYMNICLNGLQGFFLFLGFVMNARVIRMFRKKRMTTSTTKSLQSSEMTDIARVPQASSEHRY